MVISKKMKRLLCLAVVCLMLTPIISFATTDNPAPDANNNDTQTGADNPGDTAGNENEEGDNNTGGENTGNDAAGGEKTWIDSLNSGASQAATVDNDAVLEFREFLKLPEAQRKEQAKKNGIVETSKEDIDEHKYICTRGGYELYLKEDTLGVIIRDEKTGAVIRSTMSPVEAVAKGYNQTNFDFATNGLLIHYIEYNKDGTTSRYGQYTETAGVYATMNNCKVTTEEIKENGNVVGVTAHLEYEKFGFKLDVVLTMEEKGALKVEIPESTVSETNSAYMMAELYIFQMLGHSDRGDRDGYLILPDGNGIIVRNEDFFKDGSGKYKGQFIKQAYGSDVGIDTTTAGGTSSNAANTGIQGSRNFTTAAEVLNIPYFGTVFEDTGIAVLGIVEEGEYGATIMGNINGVNRSFENYNFVKFVYRSLYNEYTDSVGGTERRTTTKDRMIGDITITYLLTSDDEATYAGLANKLRDELIEEGIVVASKKDEFDLRIDFFGVDKEDFLIFRRNVIATTTDDIKEMIGKLSDKGVTNILAVYQGWQKDGVYNVPIYKFKADSDVGGNKGIEDLYDELEKNGNVDFYLLQDMVTINTSLTSSTFTSVSALTGRTYETTQRFNEVFKTFRFLYPFKTKEYMDDLVEDLLDSDIKKVAFSGMSENLFCYQDDKENFTRQTSMKYYQDALKNAKDKGMDVALQSPFMYLWKYTDAYLDFGIGSSMYVYATDEIPFVSSVLKGTMNLYSEYVNFEANSTEYFLKLVETGVAPSFLITKESPEVFQNTNSNWIYSSEYEKYEEQIIDYYNKLKAVNDKVKGEYIVNHEKLDSNVSITTYSNGVKVYVNFSDVDVTVDGMTIEAESYSVR